MYVVERQKDSPTRYVFESETSSWHSTHSAQAHTPFFQLVPLRTEVVNEAIAITMKISMICRVLDSYMLMPGITGLVE
jgi:hypothetical protein